MKILVGIPVLYNAELFRECLDSVLVPTEGNDLIDVLIIDNGAKEDVKAVINAYWPKNTNIHVIRNSENVYVTAAWQQILDYFKASRGYGQLIILNSDIILHPSWFDVLGTQKWYLPHEICYPMTSGEKIYDFPMPIVMPSPGVELTEGIPGTFINLDRQMVEIVDPLPKEARVWFSDNFIFGTLMGIGYKIRRVDHLWCYHASSSTISHVPGIQAIIEEDKVAWEQIVKPEMQRRIDKWKGKLPFL